MIDSDDVLRIKGYVCVSRIDDLIQTILKKAHSLIHPRVIKMYHGQR